MGIKYVTKELTVDLLIAMLKNYPPHKIIEFEYENGENPTNIEIKECKYNNSLLIQMQD